MGHDYTELMSAALDGHLNSSEWAEWNAHLSSCPRCQARWNMLQTVDHMFKSSTHVAPAQGFAARFAKRLARQQAAQRTRRHTFAGAGALGAGALAALVLLGWVMAWQLPALSGALSGAPTQLGDALQISAQWLVLIRALRETGHALVSLIPLWGIALALGYVSLWAALTTLWSGIIWRITRQPRAFATNGI